MEFIVPAKPFREAFSIASRACPTKTPKPVLMSIKAIADASGLTLMASDLEIGVRHRALSVSIASPGEILLPRAQVDAILRASGNDDLTFASDGGNGHLAIRSGSSARWTLATEDPAGFPDVSAFDLAEGAYWTIAADAMRKLIARTTYAADPESTRYALGGCLVVLDPDGLALVATDGRRLARQAVLTSDGPGFLPGGLVLSTRILDAVAASLPDGDAPVDLGFEADRIVKLRCEGTEYWGRLVEGRFPRYQDAIPANPDRVVTFPVDAFRAVVGRAATITGTETNGLVFTFGSGALRVRASVVDVGQSDAEMPVEWPWDGEIVVTLAAPFVLEVLRSIGGDETVDVGLGSPKDPVAFRTADGLCAVVMPMMVEG